MGSLAPQIQNVQGEELHHHIYWATNGYPFGFFDEIQIDVEKKYSSHMGLKNRHIIVKIVGKNGKKKAKMKIIKKYIVIDVDKNIVQYHSGNHYAGTNVGKK